MNRPERRPDPPVAPKPQEPWGTATERPVAAIPVPLALRAALAERLRAGAAPHGPGALERGVAAARQNRHDVAVACFEEALARAGADAEAWLQLSLSLCALGRHDEAQAAVGRALALRPLDANGHAARGFVLIAAGDLVGAARACGRAVAIDPACAPAHLTRAKALRGLGEGARGLEACDALIRLQPGEAAGHAERGQSLAAAGRHPEAGAAFEQALRRDPALAEALMGLGRALLDAGDPDGAIAAVERGLAAIPQPAPLILFTGLLHQRRGRFQDALNAFQRVIALTPDDAMAYHVTGLLFQSAGRDDLALRFFDHATRLRPDMVDALVQQAEAHRRLGRYAAMIPLCAEARRLAPERLDIRWMDCLARLHACAWEGLEDVVGSFLAESIARGQAVSPFMTLALGRPPEELQLWSRAWVAGTMPAAPLALASSTASPGRPRPGRIRLGYLSADFKEHALARLVLDLLRTHDRGRFELFGYRLGHPRGTPLEGAFAEAIGHMAELASLDDAAAARRIHADDLDILVDLTGLAGDCRPAILAHRPAPIQVSYLGYPGPMGTTLVDYLVADAVVVPHAHQPFFDERIVHLPHSYQANDRRRPRPDPDARRSDHGLPDEGFVFCCFNNSFKLTPLMFAIWLRLLDAVPGSVLWLLETNDAVAGNLRAAARAGGIAPERLVFAPRVSFERHLGRFGLADLFLDTLPYNAHTTASEALWCGVPVLTCRGEQFAGRVAASLLGAVGLPELATDDLLAYERAALALATDPERLGGLRARLAAARQTAPLFDTPRLARHLEAAFGHMMARHAAGEAPAAFAVGGDGGVTPL